MQAFSTGLELILNAAEGTLQVIVTDNGMMLCAQEWNRADHATEILAPALLGISQALNVSFRDFRRIACVRGPGSFTGIRLVLTTAAALRRTGKAKLAGLDYMQALATTVAQQRNLPYGAVIHVLTHARRNLVHFQPFISYGHQIPAQAQADISLCPPAEALEKMQHPGHACGSALQKNPNLFDSVAINRARHSTPITFMPQCVRPSIEALCLLARHGDYFAKDVEPLYIRPCDAVENLPHLAKRQGLDGQQAVETLQGLLERAPKSDI